MNKSKNMTEKELHNRKKINERDNFLAEKQIVSFSK